jgi:hypothetical protein
VIKSFFNLFKPIPILTQNNHFEYSASTDEDGVFQVKLGRLSRPAKTGFEEAKLAAQYIYENRRGANIQLCLSGGVDSECMLQAFRASGVAFKVVFLKFKNSLNEFDIKTNKNICESLGIKFTEIDLDIIDFFSKEKHLDYGVKYRCQSPQLAVHLWLLDQIDGLPALGGNPFAQTVLSGAPFFIGLPGDLHACYFRYLNQNKRTGAPWFFIYSPEMCSAFLRTDVAIKIRQHGLAPSQYSYHLKCITYNQAGFNIRPRDNKFTGFELVRQHYDQLNGTQFGVSFDKLFRKPLEEMNPSPLKYIQLVPSEY